MQQLMTPSWWRDNIVVQFETPEGPITAVDHVSLKVQPGEFLSSSVRPAAASPRLFNVIGGLLGEHEGRVTVAGETHLGPAQVDRHGVPGRIDIPLAHRDRQCRLSARTRRHAQSAAHRARPAFHQAGRARWLREPLSRRIVRRHAPARVARAHARLRAENPADGRALRRARRADAAPARRQGAADPAAAEANDAC